MARETREGGSLETERYACDTEGVIDGSQGCAARAGSTMLAVLSTPGRVVPGNRTLKGVPEGSQAIEACTSFLPRRLLDGTGVGEASIWHPVQGAVPGGNRCPGVRVQRAPRICSGRAPLATICDTFGVGRVTSKRQETREGAALEIGRFSPRSGAVYVAQCVSVGSRSEEDEPRSGDISSERSTRRCRRSAAHVIATTSPTLTHWAT